MNASFQIQAATQWLDPHRAARPGFYDQLITDVVMNEQNVVETLILEGYEKPRS